MCCGNFGSASCTICIKEDDAWLCSKKLPLPMETVEEEEDGLASLAASDVVVDVSGALVRERLLEEAFFL